MRKKLVKRFGLVAMLALIFAATSALATECALDINDPTVIMNQIAPGLTAETSLSSSYSTTSSSSNDVASSISVPAVAGLPVRVNPGNAAGRGKAVDITIDYALGYGNTTKGITTFHAKAAVAYVQPLSNGARFLTAIENSTAGTDFSYKFSVSEGAHLIAIPGGFNLLVDASGNYIGTLGDAWAKDATGADLPTHYEWNSGTLTQHVDYTKDTVFPVLLDPAWNYDYDFSATLPGYFATYSKATSNDVDHLLRGCFNCYFPISGAPRAYPVDGQILSLNASPFSFILIKAPVRVQTVSMGAMQFVAQAGHFDGAGSTITFAWYNGIGGYIHLYVHAHVMIDNGGPANAANATIAGVNWLRYWVAVANNAKPAGGGGGGGGTFR